MMRRFISCLALAVLFIIPSAARDFYWEDPVPVQAGDSRFPSSATNGTASILLWQEILADDKDSGTIWLSARIFTGSDWIVRERFAGPYAYAGEVPSIAAVTIDAANRILVTVASGLKTVSVLRSTDWCASFTETLLNGSTSAALSPRVFVRADGGYLLFATRGGEDNYTLVSARSENGTDWTSLEPWAPAVGMNQPILPTHAASGSSDIVVFQAYHEGASRLTYQLYSTVSTDRGKTWSERVLVTDFTEPGASADSAAGLFSNYHNQRAVLRRTGAVVSLVWERARSSNQRYSIYYSTINGRGVLDSPVERISGGNAYCFDPDIVESDGKPAVVWFDNRRGVNRIYLAQQTGFLWDETELSRNNLDAVFGRIINAGGSLEVYWQQTVGKSRQRVVRLSPDRSVQKAVLQPLNFTGGARGRSDLVRVQVRLPDDSSGIAGYSWKWSGGQRPEVPAVLEYGADSARISAEALEDGSWFLGVRVADYAGNWSEPAYIEYVRDTTPPAPPVLAVPDADADGFLPSNSFSLSWAPAEEDDIAGFTWSCDYIAPTDYLAVLRGFDPSAGSRSGPATPSSFNFAGLAPERLPVGLPPASIRRGSPAVSYVNRDNGIYALSVAAVDSTGNISRPSVRYFVLNKYVAHTYITYVDSKVDESGVISLSLVGRGFSDGGLVSDIHLDRDGRAPWDISLRRSNNQFRVAGDRLVTGITLQDVEEGRYRIVLDHPVRGLYVSNPLLTVSAFGTVKFGDYSHEFIPSWTETLPEAPVSRYFRPDRIFLYAAIAFALILMLFSLYGIAGTARDSLQIRQEVQALISGDVMPSEKKKRSRALRNKGVSLRFKLAFFTTGLVISVVLIVSIPLGYQFSDNQERTLARGLESRVNVLLESLASGARAYLPSQNMLELGYLPSQMTALDEALNATVTGNSSDSTATGTDFVWATNDAEISSSIDTSRLAYGKSRLVRPENEEINKRLAALDEQASAAAGQISQQITALTQESNAIALKKDAETVRRQEEIQTIARQLEEKLNGELKRFSAAGAGSWPQYDPLQLSRTITRYVFYKPVLFRQGSDTHYVHGTVRVEISTDSLLATVESDRKSLVRTTVYIALVAVLIGVAGALVLASIIISPIRKLAAHVAMIRDTDDKEELEGKDIRLRSRDEIGLLGETINGMAHGLIKAAAASKDLTVGKEVQKMFIPLETDASGRKLTCGSSKDEHAEFFGYYEGAKGVSGDYFDYIKLDGRHYAIIKCDVAGKGVPAALIMVEVATLFLDYFKDWKFEKNGYKLDYFVSRINDLIESRGFKGRFAAFTLCIFDSLSGDVHFCNAGDNLVHVFEARTHKMKTVTLPESSAAGVFPTFLVDMKGGFRVTRLHLDPGDVLFLYTDGIEEAKRLFRDKDLVVRTCEEPGLEKEAVHGSHSVGQDNEELGPERVNEIIEAVFSRRMYTLFKWHNPEEGEPFEFDFTGCDGTISEAILALVSVEKIFRMYRDPKATEFERVQVDRKVDLFLNKHFRQYGLYCGKRRDHQEYAEYLYYTNVREDSQYDDLTLLCVRKL